MSHEEDGIAILDVIEEESQDEFEIIQDFNEAAPNGDVLDKTSFYSINGAECDKSVSFHTCNSSPSTPSPDETIMTESTRELVDESVQNSGTLLSWTSDESEENPDFTVLQVLSNSASTPVRSTRTTGVSSESLASIVTARPTSSSASSGEHALPASGIQTENISSLSGSSELIPIDDDDNSSAGESTDGYATAVESEPLLNDSGPQGSAKWCGLWSLFVRFYEWIQWVMNRSSLYFFYHLIHLVSFVCALYTIIVFSYYIWKVHSRSPIVASFLTCGTIMLSLFADYVVSSVFYSLILKVQNIAFFQWGFGEHRLLLRPRDQGHILY